jgi:uncharacterized protein YlaI
MCKYCTFRVSTVQISHLQEGHVNTKLSKSNINSNITIKLVGMSQAAERQLLPP